MSDAFDRLRRAIELVDDLVASGLEETTGESRSIYQGSELALTAGFQRIGLDSGLALLYARENTESMLEVLAQQPKAKQELAEKNLIASGLMRAMAIGYIAGHQQ